MKNILPLIIKIKIHKDYIILINHLLLLSFVVFGCYLFDDYEKYKILFMSCTISILFYNLIFKKIFYFK